MNLDRRDFLKLAGLTAFGAGVGFPLTQICSNLYVPQSPVPAYTFNNDSDTGMYRIDADQVGFVVGGHSLLA